MKLILFVIAIILISYTPKKQGHALQINFYKNGTRVLQVEGAMDAYNTALPIPTVTDYKICADSISIKVLR